MTGTNDRNQRHETYKRNVAKKIPIIVERAIVQEHGTTKRRTVADPGGSLANSLWLGPARKPQSAASPNTEAPWINGEISLLITPP